MADIPAHQPSSNPRAIGRDIVNILVVAAGLFAIVAIGSAVTQAIAMPSVWITAAAYGVPALVVWLAYRWLVDRI